MLKILFWLLLAINGALFALGQGFPDRQQQRTEPQRLTRQLHPEQLILIPPAVATAVEPLVAPASSSAPVASASVAPVANPPAAVAPPAVTATAASAANATTPSQAITPAAIPNPAAPTPAASTLTPAPVPASAAAAAASAPAPAASVTAASAASAPPEKLLACVEIGNFDPNEARAFRARLAAAKLHAASSQRNVQEVASYMVYIAAEDGRAGADRRAAELRRLGLTDFYILPESSPMHDAISLGLFKTEAAAKAYVGQLISKSVRSARIIERTASTNKVAFRLRDLNAADQAGFAGLASAFPNQSRRDCSG
jgi:hypothetical protein